MNFKDDRYPMYLGLMDPGEINDEVEEYLENIWSKISNSKEPLNAKELPGLPGSTGTSPNAVFIPNSNAILF